MDNKDRPIFLLGTGRCGSTYLQRLLCASEGVWIWGEHDGFLASITRMLRVLDENRPLDKWHFNEKLKSSDYANLSSIEANDLAWMNPFSRDEFVAGARRFIVDLFASKLPPGKTRWGFKEIRYGPASRVPDILLQIFPKATIIITARRAVPTIVSSISSWNMNLLRESKEGYDEKSLRTAIRSRADNWLKYFEYFAELIKKNPERVFVYRIESPAQLPGLFKAIGVEFSNEVRELSTAVLNSSKKAKAVQENSVLMTIFKEELRAFDDKFRKVEEGMGYSSAPAPVSG